MMESIRLMWFLLQGSVIFGVYAVNIHYELTPNPVIPGMVGYALAYGLTVGISETARWVHRHKTGQKADLERVDLF